MNRPSPARNQLPFDRSTQLLESLTDQSDGSEHRIRHGEILIEVRSNIRDGVVQPERSIDAVTWTAEYGINVAEAGIQAAIREGETRSVREMNGKP